MKIKPDSVCDNILGIALVTIHTCISELSVLSALFTRTGLALDVLFEALPYGQVKMQTSVFFPA